MAREMKDSGVEWIGEIPREWRTLPLGNCFLERIEKVSDKEWEPLSVTKKGIFKQLENVAKSDAHDSRKKVCKGDFVINSRSDRKQSCGLSDFDGSVSLINIVLKNIFYKAEYTKYLLKNDGFAEEFYRWGSGIVADLWSTKYSKMKKIILPVPSLEEQEKIANYLDKKISNIDLIIEKTRATIEDYEKYKQSIITEAVTKGINPNVEMKDSGIEWIGEIPREWEVKKLKYLLNSSLQYGANETGIQFDNQLPRYIRITDILANNNLKEEGKLSLTEIMAKEFILNEGDLLFARSGGTVGKTFLYQSKFGRCAFAGYLIRANVNNKIMNSKFLYYYTLSSCYEIWKNNIFIQSTIQNIGADKYSNLLITTPPLEEQNQIAEYLDKKTSEIDTLITKKEALIAELEEYKKSLIYECVTGKKEIK